MTRTGTSTPTSNNKRQNRIDPSPKLVQQNPTKNISRPNHKTKKEKEKREREESNIHIFCFIHHHHHFFNHHHHLHQPPSPLPPLRYHHARRRFSPSSAVSFLGSILSVFVGNSSSNLVTRVVKEHGFVEERF